MEDRIQFDINESLKYYLSDPGTVPTPEADNSLVECENDPESLTGGLINGVLNPIIEAIAENPEALFRSHIFDSLQFLLKCAPISLTSQQRYPTEPESELFRLSRSTSLLPTNSLIKLIDVIVSGLSSEADAVHSDLETDEQDAVQHHKQLLEMYGFLLQWAISAMETKAAEKSATAAPARGRGAGKGAKSKAAAKDATWDSSAQLQQALDVMCKVLKLKLGKVFMTTSERDTFIGLFTRPVYLVFESEQRVKSTTIRMHCFKVLCIAVKHHGHAFGSLRTLELEFTLTVDRGPNFYYSEPVLF
jgi:condensin complex subunit 1